MPGPFHRLESPTQTVEVAKDQIANGEIWGRVPRGGMTPQVQAYPQHLPAARRGIEFTTPVDPYPSGSPFEVRWYLGITPGVQKRLLHGEEFAAIPAVIDNRQP